MAGLSEIQIRDPFILREGSTYYLYGSTDANIWQGGVGFDVYVSRNGLASFEGPFPAFRPASGFWSEKNFWAPEVYRLDDGYYMFATFLPKAGRRGTAILKASSPTGPFMPHSSGPITPEAWECLDGTLYREEGIPYMVFCHEWRQVGDGRICALRLEPDLSMAAGEPFELFKASAAPWVRSLPGRAPGSYVTDGPFLYRTCRGDLLMLWSSFGEQGIYCQGMAVSRNGNLAGPWLQREQPLYSADGGHGMLFTAVDGSLYLAIHAPNATPRERVLLLRVEEEEGGLRLAGGVNPLSSG